VVPLNFTAIDFETANQSPASPCAVGLVKVRDGKITDSIAMLFQPPYPHNWFNEFNIKVHGIHPSDVIDAASWAEVLPVMLSFIGSDVLVAHNAGFDIGVLKAAAEAIEYPLPELSYLCSLSVSRKTYNLDSYRLNAVAYAIGHEDFKHHDALADSDACARIMLHAADRHGVETVDELAAATRQLIKQIS
jgi:DNA polymerase-3 subunit epsilon